MRLSARELATGRWPGILAALGVDAGCLTGRHTPCPACGGKDRFRFDDKGGTGSFFCFHCGAGDGFALLQNVKGWDFKTAAQEVEQVAGGVQASRAPSHPDDRRKVEALRRVWSEAQPLRPGDDAMRYLAGRGLVLETPPAALRLHPGLQYHDQGQVLGTYRPRPKPARH